MASVVFTSLCAVLPLSLLLLRFYIRSSKKRPSPGLLNNKTVIITGASSGIGKAAALELAKRGATVVMACRSQTKTEKVIDWITKVTGNHQVYYMLCDLSSFTCIKKFFESFVNNYEKVDILINNAAYMGAPCESPEGKARTAMEINYLSHFYLTRLFLESQTEEPIRIINVISGSHQEVELDWSDFLYQKRAFDIYKSYAESKLALMLFSMSLERRSEHKHVVSTAVHPGAVQSDLMRNWPGWFGVFLRTLAMLIFRTPEEGADSIIHCAVTDQSGSFVQDCSFRCLNHKNLTDNDIDCLWNLSDRLCSDISTKEASQ